MTVCHSKQLIEPVRLQAKVNEMVQTTASKPSAAKAVRGTHLQCLLNLKPVLRLRHKQVISVFACTGPALKELSQRVGNSASRRRVTQQAAGRLAHFAGLSWLLINKHHVCPKLLKPAHTLSAVGRIFNLQHQGVQQNTQCFFCRYRCSNQVNASHKGADTQPNPAAAFDSGAAADC